MLPLKRSNDDDDDDFVNPPPPHVPDVVQKQPEPFPCLNTRFPPERLIQTMALLKDQQKNCVVAMGFGAALTMRLGKIPRMLSYWVVDRYNPTNNSLCVNGQIFVVTRESIRDIYGIPMGDIPMSTPVKANHEDDIVRIWKSQFPKEVKRIRLTHVIEKIINDSEAGSLFRMNFLVLYVSVMIGFPSMGTVNQSFLENIKQEVDIKRLDWCAFVLTCLNASRMTWNRLDAKCVFTGPVAFLLLFYLRCTKLEYGLKDDITHPLRYWTSERLKERELLEISKGRLCSVAFSSAYSNNKEAVVGKFPFFCGAYQHSHRGSAGIKGEPNDIDLQMIMIPDNTSLEVLLHKVNHTFMAYCKAKEDLDVLLEFGRDKFPESEEIRNRIHSRNQEFSSYVPNMPLDITHVIQDIPNTDPHHEPQQTPGNLDNAHPEPQEIAANVDNSEFSDALICTPLTQLLSTEVFDILEESALKSRGIIVTHDMDEDNDIDENVQARRRSKRCVKLTDKLRSPNFTRVLDPSSGLKSIEARVSGMVFAGIGNEWDLLFESDYRDKGFRAVFESMIPGSKLHISVIDLWATVLNHEEQRRNRNSPSRFFASCTLLSNYVLDEGICVDKRYKMFYTRMNENLLKFHPHIDFQKTDIVFFPIVSHDHFYLIVFNLRNCSCVIIDNVFSKDAFYVTYGNIPYDLDVLFQLYLDSVKHPKRSQMKRVRPVKFIMSWMTRSNYTDCGIFLMRHMETYKGEELQDWDVNLKVEDPDTDDQQVQLDDLRRKYVTKILTSDVNKLKPTVYSYLPKYDELSVDQKMELDTDDHFDRMQRRISFFD
ncbi:hypothetical protein LXL04_024771 [Taraxacum kok-saghyz]